MADAWTPDGAVMSLRHQTRPQMGVQFHPESVATSCGAELMRNFLAAVAPRIPSSAPAPRPAAPVRFHPTVEHLGPVSDPRRSVDALAHELVQRFSNVVVLDGHAEGPGGTTVACWVDPSASGGNRVVRVPADDGFRALKTLAADLTGAVSSPVPGFFQGGLLGWLPYEFGRPTSLAPHAIGGSAAHVLVARSWLVLHEDQLYAVSITHADEDPADRAWWRGARELASALREPPSGAARAREPVLVERPLRDVYGASVAECQRLLKRGESYELCLTTRVDVDTSEPLAELFASLRSKNPSRYSALMRLESIEVICASPERLVRVDPRGHVVAEPIKGTRERGANPTHDVQQREQLRASRKDRAENLMIVDLTRHDLAGVAQPGSVQVSELLRVDTLPGLHQLVTRVEAVLSEVHDAVDAVQAVFPPGSMTGAPKRRSVQWLEKLEGTARGVYSGALGYLGSDGRSEFAVVIRTMVRQGHRATVGCGGAVTVLSDPDEEYEEAMSKAATVLGPAGCRLTPEAPRPRGPLAAHREHLDRIDSALADLVLERLAVCEQVARIKRAEGLPVRHPQRMAEVLERAVHAGRRAGARESFMRDLFRLLTEEACLVEDAVVAAPDDRDA